MTIKHLPNYGRSWLFLMRMTMKGGIEKMSKIAKMQVTAEAGTDWQPTEEQEQAYIFQWAMLMEKQFPELRLLRKVEKWDKEKN